MRRMTNLRNCSIFLLVLCTFLFADIFGSPIHGKSFKARGHVGILKHHHKRAVADLPSKPSVDDSEVKLYAQKGIEKLAETSTGPSDPVLEKIQEATFFPPAGKLLYEIKIKVGSKKNGDDSQECIVNVWRESDAEPSVAVKCGQARRRRAVQPQIMKLSSKSSVHDPQMKLYAQKEIEKLVENSTEDETPVYDDEDDDLPVELDIDDPIIMKYAQQGLQEYAKNSSASKVVLAETIAAYYVPVTIYFDVIKVKFGKRTCSKDEKEECENDKLETEICAVSVPNDFEDEILYIECDEDTEDDVDDDDDDDDIHDEDDNKENDDNDNDDDDDDDNNDNDAHDNEDNDSDDDDEDDNNDNDDNDSDDDDDDDDNDDYDDDYDDDDDLAIELDIDDPEIEKYAQRGLEEYAKNSSGSEVVLVEIIAAYYVPVTIYFDVVKVKFEKSGCLNDEKEDCEKDKLETEICLVSFPEDAEGERILISCGEDEEKPKSEGESSETSDSVGPLELDKPLKVDTDEPEVKKYAQKGVEIYAESSTGLSEPILEKIEEAFLYPPVGKMLFEIKIKIGTSTCAKGQKENCELKTDSESKACTVNVFIANDKPRVELKCN